MAKLLGMMSHVSIWNNTRAWHSGTSTVMAWIEALSVPAASPAGLLVSRWL